MMLNCSLQLLTEGNKMFICIACNGGVTTNRYGQADNHDNSQGPCVGSGMPTMYERKYND